MEVLSPTRWSFFCRISWAQRVGLFGWFGKLFNMDPYQTISISWRVSGRVFSWLTSRFLKFNIENTWKKSHRCRGFLKWWYPQNTPKWSFLVGKPMVELGFILESFRIGCSWNFASKTAIFQVENFTQMSPDFNLFWRGRRCQTSIRFHVFCTVAYWMVDFLW